ncbi:MAG: hypothetical protein IJ594_02820 [Oscillospiraceae bacterium]|nr:hypothetical protein [Oscillospiraceae bacterium]
MKKILSWLLALTLLLCLGGTQALAAQAQEDVVWGEYQLTDMDDGSGEDAAAMLRLLAGMGMVPTLSVQQDGSAIIDFTDDTEKLQFDFEASIVRDEDGDELPYTYANGVLTFAEDGFSMTFTKTELVASEKKAEGAYDYYALVSCTDEKGEDLLPSLKEEGAVSAALSEKNEETDGAEQSTEPIDPEIGALRIFQDGAAQLLLYGLCETAVYDAEQETLAWNGETLKCEVKDGTVSFKTDAGRSFVFERADPGWQGYYVLTEMNGSEQGDMAEQLEMLRGLGMMPGMTVDENGSAVLDLFGVELKMQFDFETMTVKSEGQEQPFRYENGVLTMENEGNSMTFSRGVAPAGGTAGLSDLLDLLS